jgi:hypothetical protein
MCRRKALAVQAVTVEQWCDGSPLARCPRDDRVSAFLEVQSVALELFVAALTVLGYFLGSYADERRARLEVRKLRRLRDQPRFAAKNFPWDVAFKRPLRSASANRDLRFVD